MVQLAFSVLVLLVVALKLVQGMKVVFFVVVAILIVFFVVLVVGLQLKLVLEALNLVLEQVV